MPEDSQYSRTYSVGGVSIQVNAPSPITDSTFQPKFQKFQQTGGGEDVVITHHFSSHKLDWENMQECVYREVPWAVYQRQGGWAYLGILTESDTADLYKIALFNADHTRAEIYNHNIPESSFSKGGFDSLSLLQTDQIWLSRVLAERQASIVHSAGLTLNGQGFLFVGHSGAGKSTITTLLARHGEILCDDRNIVRRYPEGWRLFGTWSHGDIADVSANSAPLHAVLLLEQAPENRLIPVDDKRELVRMLPFFVVRPLVTRDWWEKTLDLVGRIAREVPVYRLQFQKSERVIEALKPLLD